MIWNKDSFGGNYVHYEGSLVLQHTHAMSHLVFIPHAHAFKIMFDSFFSKC